MQQEWCPKIRSFQADRVNRVRRRSSGDDQHCENVADIEVRLVPSSSAVSAHLVGVANKLISSEPLHRSTGSSHPPAGNEMQEHSPSNTKWQNNAIMYEYAKESKPVSVRVSTVLKTVTSLRLRLVVCPDVQCMSPIPIQAWDGKAHEEGESRVIHLDLSKDLSKF